MEAHRPDSGADAGVAGAGWGVSRDPLPAGIEPIESLEPREEAPPVPGTEVEAIAASDAEHQDEAAAHGPARLSDGVPSDAVGIVVSDAAAKQLTVTLSGERQSLQAEIRNARSDRAAKMFQTRLDRLTEVELSTRAALMDKTLAQHEQETP